MSYDPNQNPYQSPMATGTMPAAHAQESERAAFIRRTYTHLAGAILAFVAIQAIVFTAFGAEPIARWFLGNRTIMIVLILGCVGVGWLADIWAHRSTSPGLQYAGLGLYVLFESAFMAPIFALASLVSADILPTAAIMTGVIFGGLTALVWVTKADFSWMRGILVAVSLGAVGLIVCSMIFGFSLGLGFTVAMIVLASCFILYQTSVIMREYPTNMHVGAALALFASLIMLLYHIIILLIRLQGDD